VVSACVRAFGRLQSAAYCFDPMYAACRQSLTKLVMGVGVACLATHLRPTVALEPLLHQRSA